MTNHNKGRQKVLYMEVITINNFFLLCDARFHRQCEVMLQRQIMLYLKPIIWYLKSIVLQRNRSSCYKQKNSGRKQLFYTSWFLFWFSFPMENTDYKRSFQMHFWCLKDTQSLFLNFLLRIWVPSSRCFIPLRQFIRLGQEQTRENMPIPSVPWCRHGLNLLELEKTQAILGNNLIYVGNRPQSKYVETNNGSGRTIWGERAFEWRNLKHLCFINFLFLLLK